MLAWLEALCREQGAQQLWLEVRLSNARARHVYERFGFASIGTRKGYYPAPLGRREDALVMGLPTTPASPEPPDALD
jgi:ribosomal-protein-alanine N-acetyltransferase